MGLSLDSPMILVACMLMSNSVYLSVPLNVLALTPNGHDNSHMLCPRTHEGYMIMAVVHIQTVSSERARRQLLMQADSFFLTTWLTPGHRSLSHRSRRFLSGSIIPKAELYVVCRDAILTVTWSWKVSVCDNMGSDLAGSGPLEIMAGCEPCHHFRPEPKRCRGSCSVCS